MNISTTEKELRQLLALVVRWKEQGYTPDIERDIALDRLRNLYSELLVTLPVEPTSSVGPTEIIEEKPAESHSLNDQVDEIVEGQVSQNQDNGCVAEQSEISSEEEQSEEEQEQEPEQDEYPEVQPMVEQVVDHQTVDGENLLQEQRRRERFIHDLFCNDESFYIGEMRKIDALTSIEEVLIYIGQKYAWPPHHTTAEEFVEMVASRFDQ